MRLFLLTFATFFVLTACAQLPHPKHVTLHTTMGDMVIELFDETPIHRDNFLKLVNEHYYDSLLFHRVISQFMIQCGDPQSKGAAVGKMLGNGGPGYTLEAEIVYPAHFHQKGALAAARLGDRLNPDRKSSGSQFFIVQGQTYNDDMLTQVEQRISQSKQQQAGMKAFARHADSLKYYVTTHDSLRWVTLKDKAVKEAELAASQVAPVAIPANQRDIYKTVGGTPHLDGDYTVFGQVIKGLDIIDAIAAMPVDKNNRPLTDVKMWIEVTAD